jgi:hypothetical protein
MEMGPGLREETKKRLSAAATSPAAVPKRPISSTPAGLPRRAHATSATLAVSATSAEAAPTGTGLARRSHSAASTRHSASVHLAIAAATKAALRSHSTAALKPRLAWRANIVGLAIRSWL